MSEAVYEELRHQIVMGHLTGGERLDIFLIAKELGVSRTPVKDAFNRLTLEGLVTIRANRGTFVTPVKTETIAQLFDVRLMMELWAFRAVAQNRPPLDIEATAAILGRCDRLLNDAGEFDWEQFVAADHELHRLIIDAPRNPILAKLYEPVFLKLQLPRIYWARSRDRARISHHQHLAFLAALRNGRAGEAEETLGAHIRSSREHVLALLQTESEDGVSPGSFAFVPAPR